MVSLEGKRRLFKGVDYNINIDFFNLLQCVALERYMHRLQYAMDFEVFPMVTASS